MKSCILSGFFAILIGSTSLAIDYYDLHDGGHYVIDYNVEERTGISWMRVDYASPGVGTTVDFIEGGWTNGMEAYHDSILNVYEGVVSDTLFTYDNTQVTVTGGWVSSVFAGGRSVIRQEGGRIVTLTAGFDSWSDQCNVVIDKQAILDNLQMGGSELSKAVIYGGTIGDVSAFWDSVIDIRGGTLSGTITSGILGNSYVDQSRIRLAGTDFWVNGTAVGPGQYLSAYAVEGLSPYGFPCLTGTMTGILADGNILNSTFYIADEADILIIPEPTSFVLLALGALFIQKRNQLS